MLCGIIYWIPFGVVVLLQNHSFSPRYYLLLLSLICIGSLAYLFNPTTKQEESKEQKAPIATITIAATKYEHQLRLQGRPSAPTIQTIASPVQGTIVQLHSNFGDSLQKGQALFSVSSPETKQQFIDSIINYLKSKETLTAQQKKVANSKLLFASDVISNEEYNNDQNTLYNAEVDYLKIEHHLKKLCHLLHAEWSSIAKMTLKDSKAIYDLLEHDTNITVYSPANGIFLASAQTQASNVNTLLEGTKLESGQLIGIVGKPHYLEFKLLVSEDDIDSLKVGQVAKIKSLGSNNPAILNGQVLYINRHPTETQGSQDNYHFSVLVGAQCTDSCPLQVGINAAVDIHTDTFEDVFILPFSSIHKDGVATYVMRQTDDGQFQQQQVEITKTLPDGVIISSGLKEGDIVARNYTLS